MSRSTARLLMCLLVAGSAPALLPSRSALSRDTTTTPGIGVQFHAMWGDYVDEQRLEVVDKMADAGMEWFRIDFGWSSIQPDNGEAYDQWYFDRADRVVDAARARGMKILITFWRTPDWANGGRGPYAPPEDASDYARAARYTASYFESRVDAYEVWNEPNQDAFWKGTIADYAGLLKASHDDFHAGNPDARVVAGSVGHNDDPWLEKMYEAGAAGYFDVISTHPYQGIANEPPEMPDNGTKWRMSHVPAVHRLMKDHGDGSKPIWFTEFGWSSHANREGMENWERGVSEDEQADYLVRSIEYVKENFPYVENMFWYNERNRDRDDVQTSNYGLLYRNLSPKPVYDRLMSYMTGSESDGPGADSDADASRNVLRNGGFENGRRGWSSRGATLRVSGVRHGGTQAGVLDPGRRRARVIGKSMRLRAGEHEVRVVGYVKSPTRRRDLKVRLREVVNGQTLAQRVVRFRTKGRTWQAIPNIRMQTSGRSDVRIHIKIRPVGLRHRPLYVDSFQITASS